MEKLTDKELKLHTQICDESCAVLVSMLNLLEKYKDIDLKFYKIEGSSSENINGQMSYSFDVEKLKKFSNGRSN